MCLLPTRILAQGAAVAQAKKGATVMRKVTFCLAVFGVLALAFISMSMRAQNQGYPFPGYPPEFAPSRTSRAARSSPPRPTNKFNRVDRHVPGEYIVVLNDDTPESSIGTIAGTLASAHVGKLLNVSRTAIKGFSISMPEAAAIALSQDPRVLYVEENAIGKVFDVPWDLDRIDQLGAVSGFNADYGTSTGTYTPPNDGSGVNVYVIDEGIRASHHEFLKSDLTTSRVVFGVDTTGGNGTPCRDHGNLVASVVGGNSFFSGDVPYGTASFGAAKGVTLYNVRTDLDPTYGCNGSGLNVQQVLVGMDWVA